MTLQTEDHSDERFSDLADTVRATAQRIKEIDAEMANIIDQIEASRVIADPFEASHDQ